MKVICDNCRAVYKIPDEKLVKPVNKATCRQCGHRMLIPRPRMDADPDERTLVTAVPPTPAPAPPRTSFDDDPPTNPMGRNPEHTVPSAKEVEIHTATPAPVRSNQSAPPREQATRPARVPAPSAGHDPATDMSVAFVGVLLALLGSIVLAAIPLIQHLIPVMLAPITVSVALMVAAGGALLAALIMLTGERGRKPANRVLSIIVAGGLAFLVGLTPMIPMGATTVVALSGPNGPAPTGEATTNTQDGLADATDATDATDAADAADAADTTDAADPATENTAGAVTPTPVATRPPIPKTTTNTTRTGRTNNNARRPAKPTPAPVTTADRGGTAAAPSDDLDDELDLPDDAFDEPAPKPKPAAAPSGGTAPNSDLPTKPAIGAIDVMVKSNISVKKCFFKHQSSKGSLPPRIDVRFTIRPDGSATKVGIKQVEYAASDLDFCLGSAIKGIRFPPSQEGVSLTFPFQFS